MKAWLQAARLRTLPLAVSGILLGSALAFLNGNLQIPVLVMGILTAVLLQILSNFANDYGDFKKGTDTKANRQDRALASGKISEKSMKTGIVIIIILALASGLGLLRFGLGGTNTVFWIFLGLGMAAIAAAYKYTAGKNAYGYYGFGDFFVLIFFGLVSVCGIYYLHTGNVISEVFLAGLGCGLLSVGVLNVNNIRDIESDKKSHKKTIPVRIGKELAFKYHAFLVYFGFLAVLGSFILHMQKNIEYVSTLEYLMVIGAFTPFIYVFGSHINRIKMAAANDRMAYNKELKWLSLSILFFTVFYWLLVYLFTR